MEIERGDWLSESVTGTISSEFNLGKSFRKVIVLVPTITSSTVGISISNASAGTFFPVYTLDADATGDFLHATAAATTTKAIVFDIGGAQFVKIDFGASQTTETIYVRGVD